MVIGAYDNRTQRSQSRIKRGGWNLNAEKWIQRIKGRKRRCRIGFTEAAILRNCSCGRVPLKGRKDEKTASKREGKKVEKGARLFVGKKVKMPGKNCAE